MAEPIEPAARGGWGAIESCWMCGTHQPTTQMVADGGSACAEVRWYCRDVRACTQRWTSRTGRKPGAREVGAASSARS